MMAAGPLPTNGDHHDGTPHATRRRQYHRGHWHAPVLPPPAPCAPLTATGGRWEGATPPHDGDSKCGAPALIVHPTETGQTPAPLTSSSTPRRASPPHTMAPLPRIVRLNPTTLVPPPRRQLLPNHRRHGHGDGVHGRPNGARPDRRGRRQHGGSAGRPIPRPTPTPPSPRSTRRRRTSSKPPPSLSPRRRAAAAAAAAPTPTPGARRASAPTRPRRCARSAWGRPTRAGVDDGWG